MTSGWAGAATLFRGHHGHHSLRPRELGCIHPAGPAGPSGGARRRADLVEVKADLIEVKAELVTAGRNDLQIEIAAGTLGLEPNVTVVRCKPSKPTDKTGLGDHPPIK